MNRLRDRDSIITSEGIIFRVYGYSHPMEGYICDPEYAPSGIYSSDNPRAFREGRTRTYFKFFEHDGLMFILERYPQYQVYVKPLNRRMVGVPSDLMQYTTRPQMALQRLLEHPERDELSSSLNELIKILCSQSTLTPLDFGVFGSLQHGFYHPQYSDIDLVVFGRNATKKLVKLLNDLYRSSDFLTNEFENPQTKRSWIFQNYTYQQYIQHQREKLVYGILHRNAWKRKFEFEPVRLYNEIRDKYKQTLQIEPRGWIKVKARITDDTESFFMPSVYDVNLEEILKGPKKYDVKKVVSFMEEFRMQSRKDDIVIIEGNLEEVITENEQFSQITLTYGERYYEQAMFVID